MSNSFVIPITYSPPGSSVHRISQARVSEWIVISLSTLDLLKWFPDLEDRDVSNSQVSLVPVYLGKILSRGDFASLGMFSDVWR